MNVFHKVTLQSLKKNKTRTVVTIIGIILSAAMICAVTTFASSMQDYLLRGAVYNEGDWHGRAENVTMDQVTAEVESGKVEKASILQEFGYAAAERSKNEYKPYIYLYGADENTESMLPIHITSGHYPTSGSEILLPDHILSNGNSDYKIGDEITLALGERMYEGEVLSQNDPLFSYEDGDTVINNETLKVREEHTYTVVGFYERFALSVEDYSAPAYTSFTIADESFDTSVYSVSVFFKMADPHDVYDFMKAFPDGDFNTDVLKYSGVSRHSTFYGMLYSLCAIVIVLIVFGSVSLIYNAFAISVSERTKQFGLLSSIGATKKQLRKMVLFEALSVSAIGIPVGIFSGIAGIGVTLFLIGEKFSVLGYPVDMKLSVSAVSVVAAVVICIITVLISAFIPSMRVAKVSAVEAIRQSTDIKTKEKETRTSKFTYRLFGLPGVLASKHYKRSRKKYRTTIVSLFMSIVLFVSASAFGDYLIESVEGGFGASAYDLSFIARYNGKYDADTLPAPDELLTMTSDAQAITGGVYMQTSWFDGTIERRYLTERGISALGLSEQTETGNFFSYVNFINDSEFRNLAREHGLSEEDYFDPDHPLAIALDGNIIFDKDAGRFIRVNVLNSNEALFKCSVRKEIEGYDLYETYERDGATVYSYKMTDEEEYIELSEEEAFLYYDLEAKGKVTEKPYYINFNGAVVLLYPISMRDFALPGQQANDIKSAYEFLYTSSDHKASEAALSQIFSENGLTMSIYNNAQNREDNRNTVAIIQVFSYGFIVLISLIAAANVFNTISTNIGLRRREFAMLKTVGMTKKGFNRMMNYECIIYGSRSLIFGLPVSALVTYLIYRSVSQGYETYFHLPWKAMGIAALSVFLVVFATMMYAMNKVKKDNPIDALKNENY